MRLLNWKWSISASLCWCWQPGRLRVTLLVVVTWDQASFPKESTPRTSESYSLIWSCAAANDSLRCLEEAFGRMHSAPFGGTDWRKNFHSTQKPRNMQREQQMVVKSLWGAVRGWASIHRIHATWWTLTADPRSATPPKAHKCAVGVLLFPLPEDISLATAKHTSLLQATAGDFCLYAHLRGWQLLWCWLVTNLKPSVHRVCVSFHSHTLLFFILK